MPSRPTHFLCLPLVNSQSLPQLTASLSRFAQDKAILRGPPTTRRSAAAPPSSRRPAHSSDSDAEDVKVNAIPQEAFLPAKAIRPVGTLHLTLGVMELNTQDKILAATRFLNELDVRSMLRGNTDGSSTTTCNLQMHNLTDEETLRSPSSVSQNHSYAKGTQSAPDLAVQLKGLHAMQRPSKTRVLYAEPIDVSGRLLSFCQGLRDAFIEAGHVVNEGRDLKLHATIVNTIYATKISQGSKKNSRLEFDATDLIERWKDEFWTETVIEKVAICEMGAKEDSDGQVKYVEIAKTVLSG